MALYRIEDKSLTKIEPTTFAAQQIWERTHLQAALRDNIELLGDLKVVAEEFGDFTDANRRIDLLCIDRQAQLVVVELKRTGDGGHMELQALRYAAMVSTTTFDDLVEIYERHRSKPGYADSVAVDSRGELIDWLDDAESDEPVVDRRVRIVLVSAGFDKQITTTALWLNEMYQLDIRCVRLVPYKVGETVVLDVQTVIPLPEAEDYLIHLKRREIAARAAKASSSVRYVVITPDGESGPLTKRRSVLEMVSALADAGVDPEQMRGSLRPAQWLRFDGELTVEALAEAFVDRYPNGSLDRYWASEPITFDGATWLLTNQWGRRTAATLDGLGKLGIALGISYRLE